MSKDYFYNIINDKLSDISEQKIREIFNKLYKKTNEYKNILNNITEGIIISDLKGIIDFINDSAIHLLSLKYPPKNIQKIYHITEANIFQKENLNLDYTISKTISLKNKKINTIILPDQEKKKIIFFLIDKTLLYKTQMKLINNYFNLQDIIRFLNKEITPSLNSISLFLELIKKNQYNAEDLEQIKEEIKNIDSLLTNFYNSFIGENITFEKVNVPDLIEKMIQISKYEIKEKKIDINFDINTDQKIIVANRNSLQKIISTIIQSSIETIKQGGFLNINIYKMDNFINIEFKDNGVDMDYESIYKISNPYYSTKSSNPDLDLFSASNLIYKHLGDIEIENKKDQYKIITVKLPLRSEKQKSLPYIEDLKYEEK
jgi:signal transduction histidine kinase